MTSAGDPLKLLEDWHNRIRENHFAHFHAAGAFESWNYWLGLPVIILSTIVGTTVFASLSESKPQSPSVQIIVGLLSVGAAILAALQTFLRFSERAEKHRAVGARYGALRREVDELLHLGGTITKEIVSSLRGQIDKLAEEAPNISDRMFAKAQRRMKEVER